VLQHVGLEFLEVRRVQVLLGGLAGLPLCRAAGKSSIVVLVVLTYNVQPAQTSVDSTDMSKSKGVHSSRFCIKAHRHSPRR